MLSHRYPALWCWAMIDLVGRPRADYKPLPQTAGPNASHLLASGSATRLFNQFFA
jgi:hypothetical protein